MVDDDRDDGRDDDQDHGQNDDRDDYRRANDPADGGRAGVDVDTAVEFGPLSAALERHDYPTTNEELLAAVGDQEIELPEGTETLADVLGSHTGVTYESAAEVRRAVTDVVAAEPVGQGYVDRENRTWRQ